jgi:hypothetical protein
MKHLNRSACFRKASGLAVAGLGVTFALGGCITVKAPDKPIVIELNVNIKQEVVYRLSGDAAQTIDKNAEIF